MSENVPFRKNKEVNELKVEFKPKIIIVILLS